MAFVHLHNQTQYSLLDGAMRPKQLVERAATLEMPAVAITDTCNLYGAVDFYKQASSTAVRPIFGASIWTWPEGLPSLKNASSQPDSGWHLTFLVQDRKGYENLCSLITTAIFDGMHFRPRIDFDLMRRHSEGLIVLTGGLHGPIGMVTKAEDEGQQEAALGRTREALTQIVDIFGAEQTYLELRDFGLPQHPLLNSTAKAMADAFNLPTVVTNDCRYIQPTDAVTLDLLNTIARGGHIDARTRTPLTTDQQYFKTEEEMRLLFPDDGPALDRTVEIAERCNFKFQTDTYYFPATEPPDKEPTQKELEEGTEPVDTDANWAYFFSAFPPPIDFPLPPGPEVQPGVPARPPGGGSINGYFEWYSQTGLDIRLQRIEGQHEVYQSRLQHELEVIEHMGFPAYLLIVAEFINWAKDNHIPVGPGRGSAAGSIVCWAMRITDIDPIQFGLLFERFLNPERVSMPDIDVDFCQDRREEVIEHVRDKYGSSLVSQIITYGKLQAKAAIKDVARVMGLEFNQSDRIAKLVPNELNITLAKALEEEKLRTLCEGDPTVGRIVTMAQRVEGMTRQTGVHAAGVVISDRPLVEHAPLYRDGPDGGPVVQYDMKSAESVGLIKFDFLGLKTLDQLRDAVEMIERNTGTRVDLSDLPWECEKTFSLLQKGDGLGVFQVESSGMRELLTRLRPSSLDDLIALLALYRPGPLSSGMVDTFIECKHGRQAISYPHPSLQPILEATYGGIVYQEQVMQIAQVLAGYSLGEADLLRRAMGKKKHSEMAKQKVRFVEGAIKNEVDSKLAGEIFDLLAFFAGYGFNKSHSAAYGIISYQTAWLKAHHRAEYMAALMTIETNNTDKLVAYIGDCRRAGLTVCPPNVNNGQVGFDVPADKRTEIRYGLGAVKGVGEGAARAFLEARESANGQFSSWMDCLERIDYRRVNKKVLENLVKCGAFDWTGKTRRALFASIGNAMAAAQHLQKEKASGQTNLFGGMQKSAQPQYRIADLGEWPCAVKLGFERDALGFFITGHPIEAYTGIVHKVTTGSLLHINSMQEGGDVTLAGMIIAFRQIVTKRGSKMAFSTLEDASGSIECVFFPEPYERSAQVLSRIQSVARFLE